MRFLTYAESADWCSRHGYPTRQREGHRVAPDPDIQTSEFHSVKFALPTDSGRKVWLAFGLASLLAVATEIAQLFIDRSGDPLDVLRGVLGALIGVLVLQIASGSFHWRPTAIRVALVLALTVALPRPLRSMLTDSAWN